MVLENPGLRWFRTESVVKKAQVEIIGIEDTRYKSLRDMRKEIRKARELVGALQTDPKNSV